MQMTEQGLAGANRVLRCALALTLALFFVASGAQAEESAPSNRPTPSPMHRLTEAAKRDSAVAGAAIKEGAHRVAVAAKAVAHEIATATKRGAAETRAAFKGEKTGEAVSVK